MSGTNTILCPAPPKPFPGRPSLKDLQSELMNEVDHEWKIIGIYLGLDKELDIIEAKYKDPTPCMMEMFKTYLRQKDPSSWKEIIEALEKCSYKRLAEKLKNKYCPSDVVC